MEEGLYAKSIIIKQSIALQQRGKTRSKITIATGLSYESFCLAQAIAIITCFLEIRNIGELLYVM